MAYSQPLITAELEKGVLIDTIENLVDTLNWVISCWENIDVEEGSMLSLEDVNQGAPKISLNVDALKEQISDEIKNKLISDTSFMENVIVSALSRIEIVGGNDTNLRVQRSGNKFTLDLFWK